MTANESMSDRRLAQLQQYAASGNLGRCEAEELLAETKRARAALVDVTAQRDEWHRQNGHLRGERDAATTRAKVAERELAELRATLRPEYGLRYPINKTGEPDEQLASASDEETARLLAAHGDTIMQRYRTGWEEVPADGQQ